MPTYRFAKHRWALTEFILSIIFLYLLFFAELSGKILSGSFLLILVYNQMAPGMIVLGRESLLLRGRLRCTIRYSDIASISILDEPAKVLVFPWRSSNVEIRTKRIYYLFTLPLPLPTKSVYLLLRKEDVDIFVQEVSSRLPT